MTRPACRWCGPPAHAGEILPQDPGIAAALGDRDLVAPQLLHFEVMQALRGVERRGGVSSARVEVAIRALFRMPVELHPMETLASRAWQLRRDLTAYDASYVALAERLDVPLITLDRRLARAPGIRCEVIVPV